MIPEKHRTELFTEKGKKALINYTSTLCGMYLQRTVYPFQLGFIVGIPMVGYAKLIKSKELLIERIKAYAQVLCVDRIEVELKNGSQVTLDLNGMSYYGKKS